MALAAHCECLKKGRLDAALFEAGVGKITEHSGAAGVLHCPLVMRTQTGGSSLSSSTRFAPVARLIRVIAIRNRVHTHN
jgi:hypothetical protein